MIEPVIGSGVVNIQDLIDDANYYRKVRPEGVRCPFCGDERLLKQGFDSTQKQRQRYQCKSRRRYFDDLTGTIFEGHHQPLRVWILCLYFVGLNLSNSQITRKLDLNKEDVQAMALQLREGSVEYKPAARLESIVECDEVYIVARHKGQPSGVKKTPQRTGATASKGLADAAHWRRRNP